MSCDPHHIEHHKTFLWTFLWILTVEEVLALENLLLRNIKVSNIFTSGFCGANHKFYFTYLRTVRRVAERVVEVKTNQENAQYIIKMQKPNIEKQKKKNNKQEPHALTLCLVACQTGTS